MSKPKKVPAPQQAHHIIPESVFGGMKKGFYESFW